EPLQQSVLLSRQSIHLHHHLSHNPPKPPPLDTPILSAAMSKCYACVPTSSPIYSLALSTPFHPRTTPPHCLRPPSHDAVFLCHLRYPRPPSTPEGSLPHCLGISGSPPSRR
ncbi:hypothetical protein M405DRAFT_925704, partial [Rhizopogon salebrosus TDB-379]